MAPVAARAAWRQCRTASVQGRSWLRPSPTSAAARTNNLRQRNRLFHARRQWLPCRALKSRRLCICHYECKRRRRSGEDDVVLSVCCKGPAPVHGCEEFLKIESLFVFFHWTRPPENAL